MTGAFIKSVATKDRLNAVRGADGLRGKVKAGLTDDGVDDVTYGMTMWFRVAVSDGVQATPLGEWSTCSGLGVDIDIETVEDGHQHAEPTFVPKTVKYKQITLQRAVSTDDSKRIRDWLEQVVDKWVLSDNGSAPGDPNRYQGVFVSIELFGAPQGRLGEPGVPISRWILRGAYPVSWAGPGLNADSGQIATESLTLAHRGFLNASPGGANAVKARAATGELSPMSLASADKKLMIQFQPDRITMDKSSAHKTGDEDKIADPGKASFTFTIRTEGVDAVKHNRELLFEWISKNGVSTDGVGADKGNGGGAGTGTKAGKKAGKVKKPAKGSEIKTYETLTLCIGNESAGGIRRPVWLRSVGTSFTRFTSQGVPSRAAFALTVEEIVPAPSPAPPPPPWVPATPGGKGTARASRPDDPIRLGRTRTARTP